MSTPDWFLVAWWLLAAAVGIPAFTLVRRMHLLDRQNAVLDHLKGIPHGRQRMWPVAQMPGPAPIALLVSGALLVVGAFALVFMRDWTRLLLLNAQIFMVVISGCVATVGLSAKAFSRLSWDVAQAAPRLTRAFFALLGLAIVAAGGNAAIKDVAFPRRVVEGHVDRVDAIQWRLANTDYFVWIDGKRFQSTFEAFVHIHPARRVRVEIGAGSGMIFASDAQALEAARRPVKN
jgi:hypothetical protein